MASSGQMNDQLPQRGEEASPAAAPTQIAQPSPVPRHPEPHRDGPPATTASGTAAAAAAAPPDNPCKHCFREPLLRLELRDLSHKGSRIFLDNVDATRCLADCIEAILRLLYDYKHHKSIGNAEGDDGGHDDTQSPSGPLQPSAGNAALATTPDPNGPVSAASSAAGNVSSATTRSRSFHHYYPIPQTRSVTLVLRPMPGVAYTTGISLDNDHKEIHLSTDYLCDLSPPHSPTRYRAEIVGVLQHELVHCYQFSASRCPGGLIEGVADWVRLEAGLAPPHWSKGRRKDGPWDAGYSRTAFFLEWVEGKFGVGSVARLNERLGDGKEYEEEGFWKGLFGKKVEELWEEYADEAWGKDDETEEKSSEEASEEYSSISDEDGQGGGW